MRTLNLGILAHVDAGKTSLTERLLHAAGIVDELGSVDAGSTHTDFLDLERQRGITIKAAVVSFVVGDVTINLLDTPGHPDFIAEVERALQRARRRRAGDLGRRGRAGRRRGCCCAPCSGCASRPCSTSTRSTASARASAACCGRSPTG